MQFREKRLTITDEAAVVMGISGDLQSPQKLDALRVLRVCAAVINTLKINLDRDSRIMYNI